MVRDRVASWFIQNLLIPRRENIENPGFVVERIDSNENREIFLPESLFAELEKQIIEKYGRKGKTALYAMGKKYGYAYSSICSFPTVKTCSRRKLSFFIYFLVRAVETIYASRLSHRVNLDSKEFAISMNNFVICRKNGLGYILSTSGVAGIWAYMMQDLTVEAVQIKCQGRGNKECKVICAPYDYLVKLGYKPIKCRKLEAVELDTDYLRINKIRLAKYAANSLKSLIYSGFFEYKHGQVTYQGERFFLCEANFMYILEKEMEKLKGGLKTLWNVSFDFGKKLARISGKQEPCKFIADFFPALGFGDILAVKEHGKYCICVRYFPWTRFYEDIKFVMFRGMLSGIISGFAGKRVALRDFETDLSQGFFNLFTSE